MKVFQYLLLILSIIVISGGLHLANAIDANSLLGVWKEKDGTAVYSFHKEHEFEYRNKHSNDKIEREIGAWTTGTEICWLGSNKGNLTIHYGTAQCCQLAYFLGKNLILIAIPEQHYGVCANRVLLRRTGKKQ